LILAFKQKRHQGQNVIVDLALPVVKGVATTYQRIGSGGQTTVAVTISPSTQIRESFDISRVNEKIRRYNYQGLDFQTQIEKVTAELMAETIANVMVRVNDQALTFVDANKATGGGLGTEPTWSTSGDFRLIPAGDDRQLFMKLSQETLNNRQTTNNEPYYILGSNRVDYLMKITDSFGLQNTQNVKSSLEQIKPYIANTLAVANAADEALFYSIAEGGVGFICEPDKITGEGETLDYSPDTWEVVNLPAMPMFEGINTDLVRMHVKGYKGFVDNIATYASNDVARIDVVEAFSVVTKPYFFKAYVGAGNNYQPIVGYRKDAAA
jgi:hypothetical protein